MLNLFSKKKENFIAPVSGTMIPIEQVQDPVFAQKMMGDGFAIIPSDQHIYAPFSGTVTVCFPTNHAIGMQRDDKKEVLLHIGINTVELQGDGFTSHVTQGQKVKQGDLLVTFDLQKIQNLGFDPTVMVIFPNQTIEYSYLNIPVSNHQILGIKF